MQAYSLPEKRGTGFPPGLIRTMIKIRPSHLCVQYRVYCWFQSAMAHPGKPSLSVGWPPTGGMVARVWSRGPSPASPLLVVIERLIL